MSQAHANPLKRTAPQGATARWAIGALVALSASVGVAAWAHGGDQGHGDRTAAHAYRGHAGGFGPGLFALPPQRIERGIDRLLDGIDATDAQRAQVKQIATTTATDLRAQRQAGRGLQQRHLELFSAPVVDANAVEQVRQQMLAQHDQMSRRTLQAMLDVSRVLSPEQRATLAQRMTDRLSRGGKGHGGQQSPAAAEPRPAS